MKNNVNVVGGSGFLGSHVCDQLTLNGHKVKIYDLNTSPYLIEGQEQIVGDILNTEELYMALEGSDAIYHFAGLADLDDSIHKPIETVKQNIIGTLNILDFCKQNPKIKLIYASTVYVDSREGGFYRCSKVAAEDYIEEYERVFNLDYRILRYGSLYGSRSDENNAIRKIIENAITEGIVRYEGNIDSVREYIHVEDAARASVDILDETFKNQCITLTGKESTRVFDLLKMVGEILGIDKEVQFEEKDYHGHYIRTPYSYKKRAEFKYSPNKHIDIGKGILELIKDIKK